MSHTHQYSLDYRRPDGTTGGMSGGATSLDDAQARLAESCKYYTDMGYTIPDCEIREHCRHCGGTGSTPSTKRGKRISITCPACIGEGFEQPENAARLAKHKKQEAARARRNAAARGRHEALTSIGLVRTPYGYE